MTGIYLFSAIFFVIVSKKCFFDRLSVPKGILIFLLSPALGQLIAVFITDQTFTYEFQNKMQMVWLAVYMTVVQLVLQILAMIIYLKVVKANTGGIALFVYLCSVQIIPNMLILVLGVLTSYIACVCFLLLHVMFYFLTVVPLSEFKHKKQFTDTKLFVILPILTYIFNTMMNVMLIYVINLDDYIAREFIRIDYERLVSEIDQAHFRKVLIYLNDSTFFHLGFVLYPCIFVIAILIIAFYVIVKNIKYKNKAVEAQNETKTLSVEVMEALAHTIDAKDEYTRGHSIRVAKYSRMIAQKMGLEKEQCENIYYMGLLHDIGKIGVPNEIINKPSRLTDDEYTIIKTHPVTGFDILNEIKSRPDLATGARWHHERYDGKGYPDQKSGEQIPLEARIIAVADSYDAMTSNRSYRKYLPQDAVREEIEKNIGSQFDETCARCMLAIMEEDKEYVLHE